MFLVPRARHCCLALALDSRTYRPAASPEGNLARQSVHVPVIRPCVFAIESAVEYLFNALDVASPYFNLARLAGGHVS